MLHWTNRNGCGGVCGVAKYCYCLWGCPDLFCNPSFIIHSANIRWGPALLVKASWELREFAVAEEPWEHSWWTRGASPPKQKDQVDPGDRLRPVGLLNKSVLFWKPKVPFFIFRDTLLSHPLFQTVLSLLLRGWKSDLKSLFFRIWSSAFVCGGCGDFYGWVGRKMVIPLK